MANPRSQETPRPQPSLPPTIDAALSELFTQPNVNLSQLTGLPLDNRAILHAHQVMEQRSQQVKPKTK